MVKNVYSFTVYNKLCTGCGICEDVCPQKCISIIRVDGENRPNVNTSNCLGDKCGKCLKVCPGTGIDLIRLSKELFKEDEIKEDKYIGRFVGVHSGYSLDYDIRYHSASGGVTTNFLIYLLENKVIDGAVVTAFSGDKITPISYIARTKEDVIKARSSKYCPVALNKVGNEIASQSYGRYVIIGTPCHIQGFRKRMAIDKKFRDRIVGLFSVYCSSQRTFNAQDYIFAHYKIKKNSISYFSYRDNGCLGNLTINSTKGENLSVPFLNFYGPFLRSFFKPHRCLTCIDHYGELADVCFGDIHIPPYSNDHVGISSWICRTKFWEKEFVRAAQKGYIHMDNISTEILNNSQADMLFPKRRLSKANMQFDYFFGRVVPLYDKELEKPKVSDYVKEIVCHCQRFIGRHRKLWWIIEILNKGK